MPSTILLRSPDAIADKRIRMSNSQFGRPFDVGTWTKLRVCFRYGATDYGASPTGTVQMMMGLCSGTANMFGDATCQHFVGTGINSPLTRTVGSGAALYTSSAWNLYSKVGTVLSALATGGGATVGTGASADTDGKQRTAVFIDYTRVSPTQLDMQFLYRTNSLVISDVTYQEFLDQAEVETGAAFAVHAWSALRSIATVSEATNGILDTVCVYWSRTNPQIEISDIAVVRFA